MAPYAALQQDEGLAPPNLIPRKPVNISSDPSSSRQRSPPPPVPVPIGNRNSVRNSTFGPQRSESLRSELETITIQRGKFKQLVEALAISVQLLQEGIGTAKVTDPELGYEHTSQEYQEKSSETYLGVEKLPLERINHSDQVLEGVFKQGYGPKFFDEYKRTHALEPFQEHLPDVPSSRSMQRRYQLRRELWEMLLGQVSRIEKSADMYPKPVPEPHHATMKYNKIALFVEVLSSRLVSSKLSDEAEEDFDYRLKVLVTICRTNGLYVESKCRLNDMSAAACQIQMLPHKVDCEIWPEMRVGDVLSALYAEGLLEEPARNDLPGHRLNAARILESLYPLRFFISEYDWKEHFHSRNIRPDARHPHEILNMPVKDLIRLCKKETPSKMIKAAGLQFSIKLLNIQQLQHIGNLNIEWTDNLYEHLELSFGRDFSVLKIYWFTWATLDIPLARLGTVAHTSREELLSTYQIIFGVSPQGFLKDQRNKALKRYNGLEAHPRLQHRHPFTKERKMTGKYLTKKGRPYNYGTDYHLPMEETHVASFAATNMTMDLYERYPVFEDRLRILVAYMDSQKPGGLRGLWYDKRDSGAWFTFWAVLWIGGFSLLIAILSLGVSILQAIAGMKALELKPL